MTELLGYVALDKEGKPYRSSRSGKAWQKGLTNPPKIYTTKRKAESYSPVGKAAGVVLAEGEKDECSNLGP